MEHLKLPEERRVIHDVFGLNYSEVIPFYCLLSSAWTCNLHTRSPQPSSLLASTS